MPLRGESVGTAYVRVLADATGFPDSLRDEINRNEEGIRRLGRHQAQAYQEGFDEEIQRGSGLNLRDDLNKALGGNEATQQFFSGKEWEQFKSRMKSEFGSVGELAAHELEEKFVNSGSLKGLDKDVENIVSKVANTTKRIADQQAKDLDDNARRMRSFEADLRKSFDETDRLQQDAQRVSEDAARKVADSYDHIRNAVRGLRVEWSKADEEAKRRRREVEHDSLLFLKLGESVGKVAEGIGRFAGKGNRNNFVNFFGSFVGGVAGLGAIPFKILGNLQQGFAGFQTALQNGEGPLKAINLGFSEMAKDAEGADTALSKLLAAVGPLGLLGFLPVLALGLGALTTVIGPLVALVFGLAGAIVDLASTISFAVVGAIAPLIGVLGPLAAGLAVVVAGVLALNQGVKNAQGRAIGLKQTLAPLITEFLSLGKSADRAFFSHLDLSIQTIAHGMEVLRPLFSTVGSELGTLTSQAFASLGAPNSPWHQWLTLLQVQAPRQLHVLGAALGNFLNGIVGIFIDLRRPVFQFDDWLLRIARHFDSFVNSARGGREIRSFLEHASASAKQVADFLKASVGLLDQLLFSNNGRKAGDSIFASLTANIEKFTNFLRPKTTGGTIFDEATGGIKRFQQNTGVTKSPLDSFFAEGKIVAARLGQIAVDIGKIVGAFNTPKAQQSLNFVLNLLSGLDKLVPIARFMGNHPLQIMGNEGLQIVLAAATAIHNIVHDLGKIRLPNLNLGDKLKHLFGGGGSNVAALTIKPPNLDWVPGVLGRIKTFGSTALTYASRPFSGLAGRLAQYASQAATRLLGLAGQFTRAAAQWVANILSEVSGVPQQIVDMFSGLAARIEQTIGTITLHASVSLLNRAGSFASRFGLALGGVTDGPTLAGEAGREAVVPLDRPLSEIDPSVRWLAAIAQGKGAQGVTATPIVAPGKVVHVTQNISTPTTDPVGAANEWLAHLAASGY